MMNTMLSQLPPDELAGKLFLALYLQRLPAPLRERVAAKHFTDPQQLAEYADTLWEAQTRPLVTAAVLPAAQQPDFSTPWPVSGPLLLPAPLRQPFPPPPVLS